MTTTTTTAATTNYSALTGQATPAAATTSSASVNGALNQAQFLQLMTTQMTHQDPSQPMTNGDFLSQMAQFGTVSGIQDLQKSFSDFASSIGSGQALQATALVGHNVLVPATQATLETGKPLNGQITLTDSTSNLSVKIINSTTGVTVNTLQLGSQASGSVPFSWDGTDASGALADPGQYTIQATAMLNGTDTAMDTQLQAKVTSVSMASGANPLTVNLENGSSVNFNQVKQIL